MKPRPYKSMSPSRVLLIRQIIVGVMIAAFFGMLITSVWYITRLDAMTIKTVTVSGGETIPHEQIEAIVRSQIDGSYLKIVPRAFAFTYPEQDIISSIKQMERIKNLSVVRSGGNEVVVQFDEYTPHALWCKDGQSEGCFFLDENGYSFSPAPSLKGGSFLRLVSIGKDPATHTQAFDETQYHTAEELVGLFANSKWDVSKVEIDGVGDSYFTVIGGGEFKVSLKQSTKETLDNFKTVTGSQQFAHLKPGNFEYIDLRFGSKVFVNEETVIAGEQGTSTSPFTDTPNELAKKTHDSNPAVTTTPAAAIVAAARVATNTATSSH